MNTSIPIIAPVSIHIIERMEIDFNITEATYVESKGASGRIFISPRIRESEFEGLRTNLLKSSESSPKLHRAKRELTMLKKGPYLQYTTFLNPPKTPFQHLFSKPRITHEDAETSVLLGYLLLGGIETVDFDDEAPIAPKGVFPLSFKITKGLFAEIDRKVPKEVYQEYDYKVNFERIKQLVETDPEIRKKMFETKQTFEVREPLSIEPYATDAVTILPQLDGRGPRAEIDVKVMEKRRELEEKGLGEGDILTRLHICKMRLEDEMRDRLRKNEKFFGLVALSIDLKNISDFPVEGSIWIEEFSLTFPIAFSRYDMWPKMGVTTRYDPVRMQVIWSGFEVPKYESEEDVISLHLLIPHEELSKIDRIFGEIRMQLMYDKDFLRQLMSGDSTPSLDIPLASLLTPQEICDSRGIPIGKNLKGTIDSRRIPLFNVRTGAVGTTRIDPTSIYLRRIYDSQRLMELEGVHPRKTYELVKNVLNSLAFEIAYEVEPKEVSLLGQKGIKEFTAWIKGTKHVKVTPVYADIIVLGKVFMIHEEKAAGTRALKRRLKKIPKERGDTQVTIRGSSSNLNILNDFLDLLRNDIRNQIESIS